MNTEDFWNLIEAARTDAAASAEEPAAAFVSALTDRLAGTSKEAVLAYQERFDEAYGAVYRWDMWAAAYLIGGGCSDDAFSDFCAGLIAQGHAWHSRAAATPDALAQHPDVIAAAAEGQDEALSNEAVNYAASYAYERLSGDEDDCTFYDDYEQFRARRAEGGDGDGDADREGRGGMGERFDFGDAEKMRTRLPELAGLFLDR